VELDLRRWKGGEERKGKERKGKERKGKERRGEECWCRIGKVRRKEEIEEEKERNG
jgi:hypothetical protein